MHATSTGFRAMTIRIADIGIFDRSRIPTFVKTVGGVGGKHTTVDVALMLMPNTK